MMFVLQLVRANAPVHVRRRDLLGYRNFRRAMVAQFSSQSSDALTTFTLAEVLVFAAPGRASTGSLVSTLLMSALPLLIVGPIAGHVADRFSRQQILVRGHILRVAVTLLATLSLLGTGRVVGFGVLGGLIIITRVLYTARATSIPRLVRRHELVAADSTSLILSVIAGGIGGLLGGLLSAAALGLGFIVAAIGQGVASWLYRSIDADLGGGTTRQRHESRLLIRDVLAPRTRFAVLATTSHRLLLGMCLAAIAMMIDSTIGLSAAGSVVVLGCAAAGAFAGSFCAEWATEHFPRRVIASGSFFFSGTSLLIAAIVPRPYVALGSLAVAAFLFQILRVRSDASVQANANPMILGQIFAAYDIVYNVAFIAGGLLGVVLVDDVSFTTIVASVVLVYFLLAGIFLTIDDGKAEGREALNSAKLSHPTSSQVVTTFNSN
jgi:MFS family permease